MQVFSGDDCTSCRPAVILAAVGQSYFQADSGENHEGHERDPEPRPKRQRDPSFSDFVYLRVSALTIVPRYLIVVARGVCHNVLGVIHVVLFQDMGGFSQGCR